MLSVSSVSSNIISLIFVMIMVQSLPTEPLFVPMIESTLFVPDSTAFVLARGVLNIDARLAHTIPPTSKSANRSFAPSFAFYLLLPTAGIGQHPAINIDNANKLAALDRHTHVPTKQGKQLPVCTNHASSVYP
jgi:hypothetical protein